MDNILQLTNLSKTYIIGKSKAARQAVKALQKLQKHTEEADRKHHQNAEQLQATLERSQELFLEEDYDESYAVSTNRRPKVRRRKADKGLVVHALKGVSLTIEPGELVAVMGPSGSGKSTLLNMLGLLDNPTSGQILINGKNVTSIRRRNLPEVRAKQLGFVFQSFNLVPTLTAIENVMLPLRYGGVSRRKRRSVARQALKQVGLGNRLYNLPNELSGGQQQRVAIARAIVGRPAVVLGDELTGELDTHTTQEIMELIQQLNQEGQTFVIVTHNPEVAEHCRRILYMRDGEIEKDEYRPSKPRPKTSKTPKNRPQNGNGDFQPVMDIIRPSKGWQPPLAPKQKPKPPKIPQPNPDPETEPEVEPHPKIPIAVKDAPTPLQHAFVRLLEYQSAEQTKEQD